MCDICNKTFRCHSFLKSHSCVHMAEYYRFTCNICLKNLVLRKPYAHPCKMAKRKIHTCDVCHKVFRLKALLTSHYDSHSTEKPFSYDLCEKKKKFKLKSHLRTHIQKLHSENKYFDCEIWQKAFKTKPELKNHYFVHTK